MWWCVAKTKTTCVFSHHCSTYTTIKKRNGFEEKKCINYVFIWQRFVRLRHVRHCWSTVFVLIEELSNACGSRRDLICSILDWNHIVWRFAPTPCPARFQLFRLQIAFPHFCVIRFGQRYVFFSGRFFYWFSVDLFLFCLQS